MSEETNATEQVGSEQVYDMSSLNENLGEGFSFEDIGSLKERLTKYDELSTQAESFGKERGEWETKYNETQDKYNNVLSHFTGDDVIEKMYGSRDTWERVQLEKKFADKDIDAVNKIYKSDLNSINDVDAILLADKLKYKANISDEDRKSAILNRMGIEDGNLNDLDASQKYSLSVATAEAKDMLGGIKNFKPEEPTFDWLEEAKSSKASFEDKQKSLTDGWTRATTDALSAYEGTKAFNMNGDKEEVFFSYAADDKFKSEILPLAIKDFVKTQLDPTNEESLRQLKSYIDNQHKLYAYDKMIKKSREEATTRTEDELHKEIHSDSSQNTTTAPPVTTDKSMTLQEYRQSKNKK